MITVLHKIIYRKNDANLILIFESKEQKEQPSNQVIDRVDVTENKQSTDVTREVKESQPGGIHSSVSPIFYLFEFADVGNHTLAELLVHCQKIFEMNDVGVILDDSYSTGFENAFASYQEQRQQLEQQLAQQRIIKNTYSAYYFGALVTAVTTVALALTLGTALFALAIISLVLLYKGHRISRQKTPSSAQVQPQKQSPDPVSRPASTLTTTSVTRELMVQAKTSVSLTTQESKNDAPLAKFRRMKANELFALSLDMKLENLNKANIGLSSTVEEEKRSVWRGPLYSRTLLKPDQQNNSLTARALTSFDSGISSVLFSDIEIEDRENKIRESKNNHAIVLCESPRRYRIVGVIYDSGMSRHYDNRFIHFVIDELQCSSTSVAFNRLPVKDCRLDENEIKTALHKIISRLEAIKTINRPPRDRLGLLQNNHTMISIERDLKSMFSNASPIIFLELGVYFLKNLVQDINYHNYLFVELWLLSFTKYVDQSSYGNQFIQFLRAELLPNIVCLIEDFDRGGLRLSSCNKEELRFIGRLFQDGIMTDQEWLFVIDSMMGSLMRQDHVPQTTLNMRQYYSELRNISPDHGRSYAAITKDIFQKELEFDSAVKSVVEFRSMGKHVTFFSASGCSQNCRRICIFNKIAAGF